MKTIQSTVETIWKEIVKVELTAEEKLLMRSFAEEDKVARTILMDRVRAERELPLDEESATAAQAIYEANKPVLKEGDTYQLISANMLMDGLIGKGIINCRVNNEHIQVRF